MITQTNDSTNLSTHPIRVHPQATIHELIAARRSPRAFSDRPVEPSAIASLFEAARWAPSSANEQPWHFIVATKADTVTYGALSDSLAEANRRWAQRAPLLVLALAQSTYSRNGRPYQHSWYDVGQAVALLSVQATALNLAVHQMGGFDRVRVQQLLSIPGGFDPVIIFAVGYPDQPESLPDDLQKRELAPRLRKPLDHFVFTGDWGKPSPHIRTTDSLSTQLSTN